MIIDELTPERAREIGVKIGQTSHPDIVDVHVALAAAERGHAVPTSDDADIAKANRDVILVHVWGLWVSAHPAAVVLPPGTRLAGSGDLWDSRAGGALR